ncbi:MAG: hypothetical protein LBF63_03985, partial [Treponema sp.]|nr:hypothetical protein [Treponema sp.]
MNQNFVNVITRIISEQGEAILADPVRFRGLIADYASGESKAERIALGRCIEYGAYNELKNAEDAAARQLTKAALVRKLHTNEGLDMALCGKALDALEAALFGALLAAPPPPASPPPGTTAAPETAAPPPKTAVQESAAPKPAAALPAAPPPPASPPPGTTAAPEGPLFGTSAAGEGEASSAGLPLEQAGKKHTGRNVLIAALLLAAIIAWGRYFSGNQDAPPSIPAAARTNPVPEQAAPERDINGLTPADYDENGWAKKDGKWVASPDGARYSAPAAELPQVRIVNNTGYLVYYVYVVASTAQYWGDDKLGSSVLSNGGSVLVPLPSSPANRYGIMLKDLDGDTYTKWNIPIRGNQTITLTIQD